MTAHLWEASYPEGVTWNTNIEVDRVDRLFQSGADRFPDNVCCDFMGKAKPGKDAADDDLIGLVVFGDEDHRVMGPGDFDFGRDITNTLLSA